MKRFIFIMLALASPGPAVAQSDIPRAGGGEFTDFKTYWVEKRESCKPMVSFRIKNVSSEAIEPIEVRLEVLDRDKKSIFAVGSAVIAPADLPAGATKDIAIGADQDITSRDCIGDMHQIPFSDIHFAVRLTATVGHNPTNVEILPEQPMKQDRVPARD
jgi:hypothetical protein